MRQRNKHTPISRAEVHAQNYALLCVLSAVGGHHHHVTCTLGVETLQPHRLIGTGDTENEKRWEGGDLQQETH